MHPQPPRPLEAPVPPAPLDAAALAAALEALPSAVAVLDGPDHRVVLANPAFHGLARGKGPLLGRTVAELAPEEAGRLVTLVEGVLRSGRALHVDELELQLERGHGREAAWFRFSLHPLGGDRLLATAAEITAEILARRRLSDEVERHASLRELVAALRFGEARERARSEELRIALAERERLRAELQRDAAYLESVFDAAADGLVVFDDQARVVRMNEAADRLHPYDERERQLSHEERLRLGRFRKPDGSPLRSEETPIGQALRGRRVIGQLLQMAREGGPRRWISSSAAPIRSPAGEITGAVSTSADVTALVELRERIEDLNRALTHDLRTPLAGVLLQAQALRRAPTEAVVKRAAAIETGARRMATMLESLVDLARVESGGLTLERRPIELARLVAGLRERLAGVIELERVRVDLPADLPPIDGDVDLLERILVNLVGNALKYSPADRPVRLAAAAEERNVALTVEDEGAGIAPDDLRRIFDRFFRAGAAAGVPGLGLGLYITRQLVEAHGGTIEAESTVGVGSRFRVLLPAAR